MKDNAMTSSIYADASGPTAWSGAREEYVCWSRMQAEAGQDLRAIVRRKELERCAGDGLFFWGVGNAPPVTANTLARLRQPVPAVFSIMKSRPKAIDVNPTRTVAWRRYVDVDGIVRPVPKHSLVTSRGDSASGPKTKHFALMCWSDRPLGLQYGQPFDPAAFRNASEAGAPVGSSQVTALLKRTSNYIGPTCYEANLAALLVGGYWVRLADPIECQPQFDRVDRSLITSHDWIEFVSQARGYNNEPWSAIPAQKMLF
jgi:hypothetical protein